jgi:hypothetical protein
MSQGKLLLRKFVGEKSPILLLLGRLLPGRLLPGRIRTESTQVGGEAKELGH